VTIQIIIFDRHRIVCDALAALFRAEEDIEVLAAVTTATEIPRLTEALNPHLIVMDLSIPDHGGLDIARRLTTTPPPTRVVGITASADLQHLLRVLDTGATGCVLTTNDATQLLQAVRCVARGATYLTPEVSTATFRRSPATVAAPAPRGTRRTALAERERVVVQLLAEGKTSKEIGVELQISRRTVEAHRRHIMEKLGLHSIASLTKYAVRVGLVSLSDEPDPTTADEGRM
jgi:DNA-binding NarL/FixJ family response regulator